MSQDEKFWEKPLDQLSRAEWESLCDGCGRCCLHKLEDEVSGKIYGTNVACRLLDRSTGLCSSYKTRHAFVPDCVRLTPAKIPTLEWLPSTCAYKLRAEDKPLPEWHPLISGDPASVQKAGVSVTGWTVAEQDVGDFEDHIIDDEF